MLYAVGTGLAAVFVVLLAIGVIPLAVRGLAVMIPIAVGLFFLFAIVKDYREHVAYKTACPSCPD